MSRGSLPEAKTLARNKAKTLARNRARRMTDVDLHVGRRLKELRVLLAMSQVALAAKLGISFPAVQKYEAGSNRISAGRLWQVACVLEVPIGYFFEGLSGERSSRVTRLSPWEEQHLAQLPMPTTNARAPHRYRELPLRITNIVRRLPTNAGSLMMLAPARDRPFCT
jgi:transcriptional regulator with XRE-family HTH domain